MKEHGSFSENAYLRHLFAFSFFRLSWQTQFFLIQREILPRICAIIWCFCRWTYNRAYRHQIEMQNFLSWKSASFLGARQ